MRRWSSLCLVGLLLALSACQGLGAEMNRLYGLDCRPEVVKQNGGYCASTTSIR